MTKDYLFRGVAVALATLAFGVEGSVSIQDASANQQVSQGQLATTGISNTTAKQAGIKGFSNGIAGYPVGQCTGFVGSILQAKGISQSNWTYLGNGNQWASNAQSRGIKVDQVPTVGAVVSFKAYGSSYYGYGGHVAYISNINSDGSVHIYEGNFGGRSFNERDIKIDNAVAGIIHFGGESTGGPIQPGKPTSSIDAYKKNGNKYNVQKAFKIDAMKKVNGRWLVVNYKLAGGTDIDWKNNGIPVEIIDKTNASGKKTSNQVVSPGNYFKLSSGYNYGTIDAYDVPSNGIGIIMGNYGMKWFNATEFPKI